MKKDYDYLLFYSLQWNDVFFRKLVSTNRMDPIFFDDAFNTVHSDDISTIITIGISLQLMISLSYQYYSHCLTTNNLRCSNNGSGHRITESVTSDRTHVASIFDHDGTFVCRIFDFREFNFNQIFNFQRVSTHWTVHSFVLQTKNS